MAQVNICNVVVKDNPCIFTNPFQFEITFECIEDLNSDLEWKIIYVGCAESEEYDQTLDSVLVGPVAAGRHMFVFTADAPNPEKIPSNDVVGVTVVLLTCSYRSQEFIRVGYYVNNEYTDPEFKENPPVTPILEKLQRNILATSPRVTRFRINWSDEQVDDSENVPPAQSTESTSNLFTQSSEPLKSALNKHETSNSLALDTDSNMGGINGSAANFVLGVLSDNNSDKSREVESMQI